MVFTSKWRTAAFHRAAVFGGGIGVGMAFHAAQNSPMPVQVVFTVLMGLLTWGLATAAVVFYGWLHRRLRR